MKKYNRYIQTKLFDKEFIPEHWTIAPVKTFFYRVNEKSFETDPTVLSLARDKIKVRDLSKNFGQIARTYVGYNIVKKNDFLLNPMDLYSGANCNVSYVEGVISPAYINLRIKKNINICVRYYDYYFKNQYIIMALYANGKGISGDNRWTLPQNILMNYLIPIPPFEEQKQIANYLDWKINEIDKEIDNHLNKIKKMKEYKDSYVKKLVNYGVGKANKLKKIENNVFEFIPQNWQNRYIFQVSTENKVKNNNMKNRNLLSLSYGKIIEKNIDKTDGLLPESFETYQIIKTGMIVLRLTDLQNDHKSLRVGICKSTGIITSAYVVLKVTEEILPEYMYYLLHSFDISKGLYGMGRGVRQSLNYKDFSTILIPLPSLKEQRLIVDACEKIDLNIKKMIDSISKKIELLKELKNSIISEVVTGKINVRDVIIPKYEKLNVNEVIKEDSFEKGIENDDE